MKYAVCVDNRDYPVSLESRKIYEVIPDPSAVQHGHVRIVGESGEDYLYPEKCFVAIELPDDIREAFLRAS